MPDDIRVKLFNESQRLRRREKLQSMLDSLLPDFWALKKEQKQLKEDLQNEEREYEEIQTLGVASVVCRILGNLEQRVEKERQDVAAALLKLDQCDSAIQKMEERIDELTNERKTLDDAPKKYKDLFEEKKRLLQQENNPAIPRLFDLDKELGRLKSRFRELGEAHDAGRTVFYALSSVGEKLRNAGKWGLWSIFTVGLPFTFWKYECLDEAIAAAKTAQEKLRLFKSELADVEISKDMAIDVFSFWSFTDFFFDGPIRDLTIQSNIANARESLEGTLRQTRDAVEQLERMKEAEEKALRALEEKYQQAVEEA